MRETLAKNVVLNIKQLQQFRTIKIQIDFLRPIDKKESTKRRLLANVMNNSSAKYPSFKAINDREMELYGAEINAYTRSLLNFNDLGFSVEFADPSFLTGNTKQLENNLELLNDIIFHPNLKSADEFDEMAFTTEKRNMLSNLEAVDDNQDLVSMLELAKLVHLNDQNRQLPIFGDKEELKSLTNSELVDYYHQAIDNDFVMINVVGNVDPEKFSKLMRDKFTGLVESKNRRDLQVQFEDFTDLIKMPATKTDQKTVNQSHLALAFVSDKLEKGSSHLAPQAMNLIFGGDDQSQLFLQVRERNSLAYSVSSTYQPTNHLLTVQAGLDGKDMAKAIALIKRQLEFIQNGEFTDSQIEHAKKVLHTRREVASDTIQHYIMRSMWETVYPEAVLAEDKYQNELAKVSRNDIIRVANRLHIIAQYQMMGE